jgi:fatty acid desaturase
MALMFGASDRATRHDAISGALVVETLAIYAALVGLACSASRHLAGPSRPLALAPLALALGLWLDRMYTVGHEAVHRKLFPDRLWLNDLCGSLMLLPIVAPLSVYRKIHAFHHGQNRRAPKIATLDVYFVPPEPGPRRTLAVASAWAAWLVGVFAGGFFVHSLVSVLLFLLLPTRVACRVSPAFKGWRPRDRARAWAEIAGGLGLHALVFTLGGPGVWLVALGLPLAAFAWVWSMLLYIYHYRTTIGDGVRYNVRSLAPNRFFSWLLLNFNEHVTHHADPRVPWYLLPERRKTLPPAYAENLDVNTLGRAVASQLRGPLLVERVASVTPAPAPP